MSERSLSRSDELFAGALAAARAPLSRAEIADITGMSRPAASDAASRLERAGVIASVGTRDGRRGGVATLFDLNPQLGHSLAIALSSTQFQVRVRDFRGAVVLDRTAPADWTMTAEEAAMITNDMIQEAEGAAGSPLLSACISIAHPVVRATGAPFALANAAFPAGQEDLRSALRLPQEVPVKVDNDVNWATLAERRLGSMRHLGDFVYVYCGSGLGAGICANGRLLRGTRGLAAELGYLRASAAEDITEAVARLGFGRSSGYGLDVDAALDLLNAPGWSPLTREAIDVIGLAVANMCITVNPAAVVLGGPLSSSRQFVEGMRARIVALTLDPPEVLTSSHAPLEGASDEAQRLAWRKEGIR